MNEIVKKEGESNIQRMQDFIPEQIELIKRTVAKGTSDDELQLFLHIAKKSGLDPFAKQIYAVMRWDSSQKRNVMSIQTGIDGYRVIAERSDKYAPGRAPTHEYDANNKLVSSTAYIKKLVAGTWHEISATAYYSEYVALTKEGVPNSFWRTKPHIMLDKCAEALALRRAFPNDLSGIYTREEMQQANNPEVIEIEAEVITEEPPPSDDEAPPEDDETGKHGDSTNNPENNPNSDYYLLKAFGFIHEEFKRKFGNDDLYKEVIRKGTGHYEKSNKIPKELRDAAYKKLRKVLRNTPAPEPAKSTEPGEGTATLKDTDTAQKATVKPTSASTVKTIDSRGIKMLEDAADVKGILSEMYQHVAEMFDRPLKYLNATEGLLVLAWIEAQKSKIENKPPSDGKLL